MGAGAAPEMHRLDVCRMDANRCLDAKPAGEQTQEWALARFPPTIQFTHGTHEVS